MCFMGVYVFDGCIWVYMYVMGVYVLMGVYVFDGCICV